MLLIFPILAMIQAPATPALTTILENHLKAIGPIQNVQSRRIHLRAIGLAPFELPVVSEARRPNFLRKEVNIQGQLQVTAFDGRHAWRLDPFVPGGHKPLDVPAAERPGLLEEAEFDPLLVDFKGRGFQVSFLRMETLPTGPAHVLKVIGKDGAETLVFLDATSFLEVKRLQKRPINGQLVEIDTRSSDFRTLQGMPVPHRMEIRIPGLPTPIDLRIEKVEFNVTLDPSRFQRPGKP